MATETKRVLHQVMMTGDPLTGELKTLTVWYASFLVDGDQVIAGTVSLEDATNIDLASPEVATWLGNAVPPLTAQLAVANATIAQLQAQIAASSPS
ncbi:hypothetical protein [Paraburkholderia dipogonis]|jgi:hypothetical protein|uniref:hypothetical protein n=2 Tax=Paraburkholderia TaxID=1822464 RepID=UPI0038B89CCF